MNYRLLLWKYMNHVGACEGTDFVDDGYRSLDGDSQDFSDEEWAELVRISQLPEPPTTEGGEQT